MLLVIGEREMGNRTVAVRAQSGADLGEMSLEQFTDRLRKEVAQRGQSILED